MMILLTLVAVGLLSLSSVALRSSSQSQAAATAKANARMALMLALGELQAGMGPDQRVSAPAASVTDKDVSKVKQPHLTGIWDSWRWDPAAGGSPDYGEKANKFRRWLVSTTNPQDALKLELPKNPPTGKLVELAGEFENNGIPGSVQVAAVPLTSGATAGAFGWAVFDESTKAAINLEGDPGQASSLAENLAMRTAPPRMRADVVDSAKLASLRTPKNLISLATAAVPAGSKANAEEIRRRFHDFTAGSLGLLSDTANGGLKTDLTQLFEAESFDATAFPGPTLYADVAAGAPLWEYLRDHYRTYKLGMTTPDSTPLYKPDRTRDLNVTSDGLQPAPERQRLMPVIARMQLIFSLVSHNSHFPERINFYNTQGDPKGNDKHAVPHIVYEPIITLYNPYNVALELRRLRVRVWDPPVGFRFAKISGSGTAWYRPEMANGDFHSLARFSWANEFKPAARRFFTLYLTDGTSERAGSRLRLQPGEVKVYSARVERAWSWSLENQTYNRPRAFFDWMQNDPNNIDFGNIDNRTANRFGVEAVPGWDLRAGLQTDHLSYSGGRPLDTIYDFEKGSLAARGWVSIRTTDQVRVEVKAQRSTGTNTSVPDFQVDLLAGNNTDHTRDILRTYQFRFEDPTAEISEVPGKPVISRDYNVGQTLQAWTDRTLGGKKCLAMLDMTARTTRDPLDDSKAWVFNNPVVEGVLQDTRQIGAANQSYDLRLIELSGWGTFPNVEWDSTPGAGYGRGYFGASRSSTEGVTNVPMYALPLAPTASLGEFIPANLVASSQLPRVVHPFGNSRAHPLVKSGETRNGNLLDHSYFINDSLWDRYFFSSATEYKGDVFGSQSRSRREVIQGMLTGNEPALNPRLVPVTPAGDATTLASELDGLADTARARRMAAHLGISGPFNLNSTSVDAWRAVLSSLRDREVKAWNARSTANGDKTPFVRGGLPLTGPSDTSNDLNIQGQIRWAGYRNLSDTEIKNLAEKIVEEIRNRGVQDKAPPLTLAEFVNRRPGGPTELHSLAGILQTAIDRSGVNEANHAMDSKNITAASINAARKRGVVTEEAMNGQTGEGAPSILTQGDLLGALAPIATVRGDTFKIRAYGEARSATGQVEAQAWCEAIVQRVPEFVDPADPPETAISNLTREANKRFGRRFIITSFRWLNPEEIRPKNI